MITGILLTILSYLLMGALFAGLGFLLIRDDLVATAISNGMRPAKPLPPVADTVDNSWTQTVESLLDAGVPPVVCVQVLANRLRKFQSENLTPLDKRLEMLLKRLADVKRDRRRAWMAQKFERSQLLAGLKKLGYDDRLTVMKTTNTGVRKKVQKSFVEEIASPFESPIVDIEQLVTSSTPETQISSDTPTKPDESFIGAVKELGMYLIGMVLWIKNAFISKKYRRRAIRICRAFGLVFNRKIFRRFVRKVVHFANKLFKITTFVHLDDGTTKLSLEILPKM